MRCQFEDEFFFVIGERVLQRRNLAVSGKLGLERFGRVLEALRGRARQFNVDGIAPWATPPTSEADRLDQRMLRHRVLKVCHKGKAGIGPQIGINQLDGNRSQLIALFRLGARQSPSRRPADFGQGIGHRVRPVFRLVFGTQTLDRVLNGAHNLERIVTRRAGDHGKVARDRRALGRIEKAPGHVALQEKRHLTGKYRDHAGDDDVPCPDHQSHKRTEHHLANPPEAFVHLPRRPVVPMLLGRMGQRVTHVVRQDQEAFDQRGHEDHDDGERNVLNKRTKATAQRHQSEKGDDRRQCRCKNRGKHPPRRVLGSGGGVLAKTPRAKVGVFAHNDGVVDNYAERDDQSKERDHVDRQTGEIHDRNGCQHGHGNTRGDPEGGTRVQEKKEQRNHKSKAHQAVVEQDIQTTRD